MTVSPVYVDKGMVGRSGALLLLGLASAMLLSSGVCAAETQAADQQTQNKHFQGWLLDAHLGAVRVAPGSVNLAGAGTFGYGARMLGGSVSGSGNVYENNDAHAARDTQHLDGEAMGWLLLGKPGDAFRLKFDFNVAGSSYDSTYIPKNPTGDVWRDQTSWLWHGTASLGLSWVPSPSFSLQLSAGGGAQIELYDYQTLNVKAEYERQGDVNTTARGRWDARTTWRVVPDTATTRLHLWGKAFRLSRDRSYIAVKHETGTTVDQTREVFTQVELSGRLFVDLDVLSWYGFEPTVYGGVDMVRLSGTGGNLTTWLPVVGGGLLHPWW